ncbi:hypothetical protein EKK97_13910 [Billgrantia tianxiuensis]|uniref:Helix-turn-helix domain-containing protein n=1 Tax=Billgrantia tianxiuensis TaxID=2497861 RepID=A0A6I6SRT3_9GAMM|nr:MULTISPECIES: hypothetical protein [Halomonas]MCE8034593.1 hypothetical protein [Halomonas sp. MCCC 1A11057]QHC50460.1 hypothetical protein EKK97_13910 [Halomonas tianxiuensis]
MGTVTQIKPSPNRLENPEGQLGRVHMVLRDATYWMQLHEIGEAILSRFQRMDSHAAISARIRELRGLGVTIVSREVPGKGAARPHEYRLVPDWDGGAAA